MYNKVCMKEQMIEILLRKPGLIHTATDAVQDPIVPLPLAFSKATPPPACFYPRLHVSTRMFPSVHLHLGISTRTYSPAAHPRWWLVRCGWSDPRRSAQCTCSHRCPRDECWRCEALCRHWRCQSWLTAPPGLHPGTRWIYLYTLVAKYVCFMKLKSLSVFCLRAQHFINVISVVKWKMLVQL